MQQLSIKRGDTLYAECQLVDEFGAGQSLVGIYVQAKLVDRGGFEAHSFEVIRIFESQGKYALAEFNTGSIPQALYTIQISYIKNGATISNTAFELNVCKQMGKESGRFAQLVSLIGNTRVLVTVPSAPANNLVWNEAWNELWVND